MNSRPVFVLVALLGVIVSGLLWLGLDVPGWVHVARSLLRLIGVLL